MELTKATINVQLEIYVKPDGTFERAVATRRHLFHENGALIGQSDKQIELTLAQAKAAVAAL